MSRSLPIIAAALLLVSSPWLVSGSGGVGRRRVQRLAGSTADRSGSTPRGELLRAWRYAVAGGAAVASLAGFGSDALGIGLAAVAGVGIVVVLGRDPPPPTAPADEVALVMELIAGCLDAGLSLVDALAAGRRAASDPVLVRACEAVTLGLRRGDRADQVFAGWLEDPVLSPFGRTAGRAAQTGAAVADELRRCSARLRAARRTSVRRRVQRVSVFVAVPLGLCFLPAFVCVAVVPTVVGLFPSLH
jgi:hypothetical protein